MVTCAVQSGVGGVPAPIPGLVDGAAVGTVPYMFIHMGVEDLGGVVLKGLAAPKDEAQ